MDSLITTITLPWVSTSGRSGSNAKDSSHPRPHSAPLSWISSDWDRCGCWVSSRSASPHRRHRWISSWWTGHSSWSRPPQIRVVGVARAPQKRRPIVDDDWGSSPAADWRPWTASGIGHRCGNSDEPSTPQRCSSCPGQRCSPSPRPPEQFWGESIYWDEFAFYRNLRNYDF